MLNTGPASRTDAAPPSDRHAVADRLALALTAADAARDVALASFQTEGLTFERKADGSPVTPADRDIETLIRERIRAAFPFDAVCGEEFGPAAGSSGYTWVIDPIDGTRAFVRGVPTFGVLIGLEHLGRVVTGVADYPALGERLYASAGGGAWCENRGGVRPAAVSRAHDITEAVVETTHAKRFMRLGLWPTYERLCRSAFRTRGWSDAYAFNLVATGRVDAAVALGVSAWDIAPFVCIIEEAGGRLTDWQGQRTLQGSMFVCGNPTLHAALLRILAAPAAPTLGVTLTH